MRQFFSGFMSGFQEFSHSIANAVNLLVLSAVYFIGVGIVSTAAKIAGKKFLQMEKRESYWVKRNLGKRRMEEYKRTF